MKSMTREDPPPPYQTWEACRFDEQLNKACEAQGIDLQDVASRIGKSVQALRNVRYGISSPRASTIADIEAALHWVPGGYEQARQGKTPASAPREDPLPQRKQSRSACATSSARSTVPKVLPTQLAK